MQPLEGITVLDLTRLLPGAVATLLLRRAGAEVIKVEEPGSGDYARSMPPFIDGEGAVFRFTNAGKKSVAINLKDPQGRKMLLRLAAKADVLVEGFRPGVMERLDLGCETLRQQNPRLIYASLAGYPAAGPWAGMAGHDVNYLALAGLLDLIGVRDGQPVIPGVQIADISGGSLQVVIGVLLALLERERTGVGRRVEINMLEGLEPLLILPRALMSAKGKPPPRGADVLSGGYPCYNLYRARDGRWLAVGALERKFWQNLCRELGREDLTAAQFHPDATGQLQEIFLARDAGDWFDRLKDRDCCVTPVLRLDETPALPLDDAPAPRLGEHTSELLG